MIAISGDNKKVLLKPDVKFNADSITGPFRMSIENEDFTGWVLFDLETGAITKGSMKGSMDMLMSAQGQDITMKMIYDVKTNLTGF